MNKEGVGASKLPCNFLLSAIFLFSWRSCPALHRQSYSRGGVPLETLAFSSTGLAETNDAWPRAVLHRAKRESRDTGMTSPQREKQTRERCRQQRLHRSETGFSLADPPRLACSCAPEPEYVSTYPSAVSYAQKPRGISFLSPYLFRVGAVAVDQEPQESLEPAQSLFSSPTIT